MSDTTLELQRSWRDDSPAVFLAQVSLTMPEILEVVRAAEEWKKTVTGGAKSTAEIANAEGKIMGALIDLENKRGVYPEEDGE